MAFSYLIKSGTIVSTSDIFTADVKIRGEKIVAVGENLPQNDVEVIDARGKFVFPGGIDVHTHLDLPFAGTVSKDDFETGTIAAACGGTTTIVDFCCQNKGQSLREALTVWSEKAEGKAVIDYGFHVAITDLSDVVLQEIPSIIKSGCPTFKLFMTYDGWRSEDDNLFKALLQTRDHGGLVSVHAENYYLIKYLTEKFRSEGKIEPKYHPLSRPPLVEAEATGRAIKLAMLADAPLYIVHLTCNAALEEVDNARRKNAKIMAETCSQYLLLSEDLYSEPDFQGAKYVMSPPLRSRENQEYLWRGLKENNLQVVATDHCSFDFKKQKEMGRNFFAQIPSGIAGIEARLMLLYSYGVNPGKISLNRFVAITATNPAKIFGMYPQKGIIAPGSDADLVIFDPNVEKIINKNLLHENVDYTPYDGIKITGFPIMTFSRGRMVVKNGEFIGELGAGKFVARKAPVFI